LSILSINLVRHEKGQLLDLVSEKKSYQIVNTPMTKGDVFAINPCIRASLPYIDRQIKFRGPVYCPAIACGAHNTWPLRV
jgi:hypothetical protein